MDSNTNVRTTGVAGVDMAVRVERANGSVEDVLAAEVDVKLPLVRWDCECGAWFLVPDSGVTVTTCPAGCGATVGA